MQNACVDDENIATKVLEEEGTPVSLIATLVQWDTSQPSV